MKKMKKFLGLSLAVVLSLSMLAGCSSNKDTETKAPETAASNDATTEDFKIGFIYDGEIGDGGYTQAHDDARKVVEAMEGVTTMYVEGISSDSAAIEKVCEDFISNGCKMIIGTSFAFQDGMFVAAGNNPDIIFEHFSGYFLAENYGNYFGKIYQIRYLSGMVAGLQTESNKIGYVAAFAIPEVVRGINAFALGVQAVNPDATVEVSWTSTWNDSAIEKDAATALISKGCDVIAQHQNTTGPQVAAEEAGVWGIGYNKDMSYAAPTAALTAPIWTTGAYLIERVEAAMNGTWTSASYFGPASDNVVDLAPLTDNVKEGTAEIIKEKYSEILKNGNNDGIFVGPITDNKGNVILEPGKAMGDAELLSPDTMSWLNENVIGTVQ
jgi:Uncharacterized ABC-type transport system, periplasmic component/surface lipoprotein